MCVRERERERERDKIENYQDKLQTIKWRYTNIYKENNIHFLVLRARQKGKRRKKERKIVLKNIFLLQ